MYRVAAALSFSLVACGSLIPSTGGSTGGASAGGCTFTIDNSMGASLSGTTFTSISAAGTYQAMSDVGTPLVNVDAEGTADGQIVIVQIEDTPAAGKTYTAVTGSQGLIAAGEASISYGETQGSTQQIWESSGGTITIDSVSGQSVHFTFTNVPMSPNGTAPGMGTFSLSTACQATVGGL